MTKQAAKKAYVESVLSSTEGKGVVVCPVFIEEPAKSGNWVPTDTAVIEGTNPEWCAINVMSITTSFSAQGFENQNVMSALIRRKIAGADDKYVPGAVLNGKIAIMETLTPTDDKDESRDIKYPSAALAEAGIACTVGGKPIYQRKYYTDNLQAQDITIAHDNDEEINQQRAAIKAANSKPSTGINAAAAKNRLKTAGK